MFGIIGAVAIIAILGTVTIKYNLSTKEKKAIRLSQDYLSQKYTQEMQYLNVKFSWIDPAIYHVSFSPVNMPELVFEVLISQDLTSPREWTNPDGSHFAPDNYYLKYFSLDTRKSFQTHVQQIWGTNTGIVVPVVNLGLYAVKIPLELNEQMKPEDMEPFLDYDFYVTPNQLLDDSSKAEEAQKIFEMIQIVQASGYKPNRILFWYQTGNKKKNEKYTDSKTWAERDISFEDWNEISSVEQIEKRMNETWFNG